MQAGLRVSVLAAAALLVLPMTANATTTMEWAGTGTGSDGALSGQALFTFGSGSLSVEISNLLGASSIRSSGQAVSGISFTLGSAPGNVGSLSASGQLADISSAGNVTDKSGNPSRWISSGHFSISGNAVTLDALGGRKPNEMIIPQDASGAYSNVNTGFDQFNPYVDGPGTFTLALSGVTDTTTISNVQFSFGTSGRSFVDGTCTAGCGAHLPPPSVPEPASFVVLAVALAGLGFARRRQAT